MWYMLLTQLDNLHATSSVSHLSLIGSDYYRLGLRQRRIEGPANIILAVVTSVCSIFAVDLAYSQSLGSTVVIGGT
jgi:hypothetical protein